MVPASELDRSIPSFHSRSLRGARLFQRIISRNFFFDRFGAGLLGGVRYDLSIAAVAGAYWSASPLVLKGVAFVTLFFVVYFLLNLTGWLLHRSEKILFLQTLNRVGGVVIGIGKGSALTALIVLLVSSASWVPHTTRDEIEGAYLISPLSPIGDGILRIGSEKR